VTSVSKLLSFYRDNDFIETGHTVVTFMAREM